MARDLYPLIFRPVLVSKPRGGKLLGRYLEGAYGDLDDDPGEAWLLFDDGKRSSVIANGPLEQTPLADLVRTRADELVGRHHASQRPFPLALRLIDAGSDQPLQVHPDLEALPDPSHPTNAKFWHSLASASGARIIVGISQQVTNQQILLNLDKPGFERLLQCYPARLGDSYLVPPGFVHSIGAGNLVLEVQQRYIQPLELKTGDGPGRDSGQRHLVLAAIKREARHNLRISREAGSAAHTRRIMLTPNCPYFQIEEIRLKDHIFLRAGDDSFNLIAITRGHAAIRCAGHALELGPGMICCIPSCCGDYKVEAIGAGAEMLRIQQ